MAVGAAAKAGTLNKITNDFKSMKAHILILIYAPNHDNGWLTDSSFPLRLFRPKIYCI